MWSLEHRETPHLSHGRVESANTYMYVSCIFPPHSLIDWPSIVSSYWGSDEETNFLLHCFRTQATACKYRLGSQQKYDSLLGRHPTVLIYTGSIHVTLNTGSYCLPLAKYSRNAGLKWSIRHFVGVWLYTVYPLHLRLEVTKHSNMYYLLGLFTIETHIACDLFHIAFGIVNRLHKTSVLLLIIEQPD